MRTNSPLKLFFVILVGLVSFPCFAQKTAANRDNVIAQMNYCMTTLTNIIHNKSIDVLEHESDQLINNLTMEQIVGLDDIKIFREDLLDAVSRFEITEEERNVIRRVQSLMNDKRKWGALSNALSSTMLLFPVGGGNGFPSNMMAKGVGPQLAIQIGFQTLLTAARTAVEYKESGYDQNAEELQAMWELRKEDMVNIQELRKQAHSIIYNLYEKYNLNENDRLTEKTANLFNEYVTEPDASKRIRLLEDNRAVYKHISDYYYFLGMAYLDNNDYQKAKPCFDEYIQMYTKSPILRYNEKLGTIALAKLTYEKQLNNAQKEGLLQTALKNLPNNSAAVLQCAMIYINDFKDINKGLDIIRLGIDDPRATDAELLISSVATLMPYIKNDKQRLAEIKSAVESRLPIIWDSYMSFYLNIADNPWEIFAKNMSFSDLWRRDWWGLNLNNYVYYFKYGKWLTTFWSSFYSLSRGKDFWKNRSYLNDKLDIILSPEINYKNDGFKVFHEYFDGTKLTIQQLVAENKSVIKQKDLDKVDCFKHNKNLKYLFVNEISENEFRLKKNLDIDRIKDLSFPRLSEFVLNEDDVDEIVDFIKKWQKKGEETKVHFYPPSGSYQTIDKTSNVKIEFKGDRLIYTPHVSPFMRGTFLRIVTPNKNEILYKFDRDSHTLSPFMYVVANDTVFAAKDLKAKYYLKSPTKAKVVIMKLRSLIQDKLKSQPNKGLQSDLESVSKKEVASLVHINTNAVNIKGLQDTILCCAANLFPDFQNAENLNSDGLGNHAQDATLNSKNTRQYLVFWEFMCKFYLTRDTEIYNLFAS